MKRPPFRKFAWAGLIALGLYDLAYIVQWALNGPQPPFGDFFGLWSFGKFAQKSGSLIYDPSALAAYQHILDPAVSGSFPFPYPPTFLLVVIPLGLLKLPAAYLVWLATTFVAYLGATLGRSWRTIYGLGLLVAPTTLLTVTSGQNGLLTGALLVGGLNSLRARPVLAGVLLALLTYKPQFALLVPVTLLASGSIAALLAFACTGAACVLATSILFGWSVWPRWIAGFPAYQHLLGANQASLDHLMPTIIAGLHMLGGPSMAGLALHVVMALAVAFVCWRTLRRGLTERAIALSIIGSFLVAPYAMIYDTPMIASAIVLHWQSRLRRGAPVGIREVTLVIATFGCFFVMVSAALPLLAPLLLLANFVVVALREGQADGKN
jgi:hypothetical protein